MALKGDRTWRGVSELLHQNNAVEVNEGLLLRIIIAGAKSSNQYTVPYELYKAITTKEPDKLIKLIFREPPQLARKIADWHCYFFDVGHHEFARQVSEQVKKHGLEPSRVKLYQTLFTGGRNITGGRNKSIDPLITDVVAEMFNAANGMRFSSLDEIEEFVNYAGAHTNRINRDIGSYASWRLVKPVIDALMEHTGNGFAAFINQPQTHFASGRRRVSAEKYVQLRKQLEGLPQYAAKMETAQRLVNVLSYAVNALQSLGAAGLTMKDVSPHVSLVNGLTISELELIKAGMRNYGEEAFTQHVFQAYMAIRQEHSFPPEQLKLIIDFPMKRIVIIERVNSANQRQEYAQPPDKSAEVVGKLLLAYKHDVLDKNKKRGFNIGVTEDGINRVLSDAWEKIHDHVHTISNRLTPVMAP